MFKAAEKLGDDRRMLGALMEAGNGPQRGGDKGAKSAAPTECAFALREVRMKKLAAVMLFVGGLAIWVPSARAQGYPADNSGKNVRDRKDAAVTAGDQSNTQADLNITQEIRKAVMADEKLSTNAQNVKIITANGVVTLRGPVKSAEEKANVGAKAAHAAGVTHVDNQLEIAK